MRAERYIAPPESGMNAKHITHIVDADVIEADFAKALGQPSSARRLAKRRRRNPRHLHLPLDELRLLSTKPIERRPHLGRRRQACHFLLHRRSNVRHIRARGSGAHGKLWGHITTRHKERGLALAGTDQNLFEIVILSVANAKHWRSRKPALSEAAGDPMQSGSTGGFARNSLLVTSNTICTGPKSLTSRAHCTIAK